MSGVGISRRGMLRCVPLDAGMAAMLMAGQKHPPFLFWSCQKRNGPCTVQREKTLRRVGLRRRRPPAAGGGWLAVPCGGQGRKRPALGGNLQPGEVWDTSSFSFRCRWPVVDGRLRNGPMRASAPTTAQGARSEAERAEREAGQMRSCTPALSVPSATGRQSQKSQKTQACPKASPNRSRHRYVDPRRARRATAPERA